MQLSQTDQVAQMLDVCRAILTAITKIDRNNSKRSIREHLLLNEIVAAAFEERSTSVSILAKQFDVPKATVSRHVSKFIKEGIVHEATDKGDRRVKPLLITASALVNAKDWADKSRADMKCWFCGRDRND